MFRKSLFLLTALSAISASAAPISLGILGGAPFTDVINATNQNNFSFVAKSTNFTVGPSFQVNLPLNLRFEVDALYRPYGFIATCSLPAPLATCIAPLTVNASQWRFPFLGQYRFNLVPVIHPFIEAGFSWEHLANISTAADTIASGAGHLVQQSHAGVVLGGGVDVKVPFVRISGELRYTHQGSADFQALSNTNQAEFLLGVHF
jgi:hypothetical protein